MQIGRRSGCADAAPKSCGGEVIRRFKHPTRVPAKNPSTFVLADRKGKAPGLADSSHTVQSFPPVTRADARILILGSMPGQASLRAQQYYAHPHNAFWRILSQLFGFSRDLPYPERLQRIQSHGIALWDVLYACARRGSLDADIEEASIIPNAIGQLLGGHPGIRRVYFNGSKAEQAFRRYIAPTLPPEHGKPICLRLPSTSPAHASRSFEQKLEAWRVLLRED